MSFDFPNSPTEGQIFSPSGGPTYVFNSPVWKAMGQGQIAIVSDSAPANPANGQLWWESDTGILFIWVNDGNSSQWVQCGGIAAGGAMNTVVFTSSGTYTAPQGLRYLEVSCWGGGGAGGGTAATAAGQGAAGSGGTGGAMAYSRLTAVEIGASQAVTIGSGGASVSGAAGGPGTGTSFGSLVLAASGTGGLAGSAIAPPIATQPGIVTQSAGGQIRGWTAAGGNGSTQTIGAGNRGGIGGNTVWGGAGISDGVAAAANTGSGGGGNAIPASTAASAGGAGGSGIVVLRRYF